ncbi:MAG: DNA-binding transcriptional MocR family regulator [Rhodothermales bacterium]|jgi:DNA-binding transcriptional MocR family regulator
METDAIRTLCYGIARGLWPSGTSLPSVAEFAAERRINLGAVRAAMRRLHDDGLLDAGVVTAGAPELARAWLLADFATRQAAEFATLQRAGISEKYLRERLP